MLGLLFVLLVRFLCSSHIAVAACDQPHGPGAAFYKFTKVVIYYVALPRKADQYKPGFPNDLKTDTFKKHVEDVVRENFTACLPKEGATESSILSTDKRVPEMLDPNNVVLLIRLSWPYHINNDAKTVYAILHTSIFRAGLSTEDALEIETHSYAFSLYPDMDTFRPLADQLDKSLHIALQPFHYGTGHAAATVDEVPNLIPH